MLTKIQLQKIQMLIRKPRNEAVSKVINDLFLNYEIHQHEAIIDRMDEKFEFKRYVRENRETLLQFIERVRLLNTYLESNNAVGQTYFDMVIALYQYAPNTEAINMLELRIVHQVPASRVAAITGTSLQQLSRLVRKYNDRLVLINDVREHFL